MTQPREAGKELACLHFLEFGLHVSSVKDVNPQSVFVFSLVKGPSSLMARYEMQTFSKSLLIFLIAAGAGDSLTRNTGKRADWPADHRTLFNS